VGSEWAANGQRSGSAIPPGRSVRCSRRGTSGRATFAAVSNVNQNPPGWHPDPFQRHQMRYWDGNGWSEHVSTNGVQSVDPPTPAPLVPTSGHTPNQIQQQVQNRAGAQAGWQGDGTLFNEPILVVNQKAKIFELENEYAIFDQHGRQLGAVRQVGQSTAKKAMRLLTSMDQYMTHKLQLVDAHGNLVLNLTRPAKMIKSKIHVTDPGGREIGSIVQQNAIGKIRFGLEAGGSTHGSINAENWRAWNFNIQDHTGQEVARITKTWEGLAAAMFTSADNYVVHIHRPLVDPLRMLVLASAVSVDTALKQDAQGFN